MPLIVHQFPCLEDNYGYFIRCDQTGRTAAIDIPNDRQVLEELERLGWDLDEIWNTHHHWDHAHDNPGVVNATEARVLASQEVEKVVGGVDTILSPGDTLRLGAYSATVIDVGGHTLGHIAFHFADQGLAFVGDSLFALGCGRMFEGQPDQMQAGLARLKALPDETMIYCAHEYSAANARFATHMDPENAELAAYRQEIDTKRENDIFTVPFPLEREKRLNPFLRWDDVNLLARHGLEAASPHQAFAYFRRAKDQFKG